MVCRVRSGMHVDGTWGSFAAAHLFGATPNQALAALNHVACHMPFSLYWPIAAGSTMRNPYPGHGAAYGMAAAVASLAGLGGPPGSITEMARPALAMTRAETLAKFHAYAGPVIGAAHASAIAAPLLDGALDRPLDLDA